LKLGYPTLVLKLPCQDIEKRLPKDLWKQIPEHINHAIEMNKKIEEDERIAQLSSETVDINKIIKEWEITSHFEITSYVPGCDENTNQFNLMYQGWLFQSDVADESTSQAWSHPLVGIFHSHGFQSHQTMFNLLDLITFVGVINIVI